MPDLAISSFPSALPGQVHTEQSPDTKNTHLHATPLHSLFRTNKSTDKSKNTHQHINTSTFIQYNYRITIHYNLKSESL